MKGFYKKLTLACALAILTVVLLTYVFILYFEALEENQYRITSRSAFESSVVNLDNYFDIAKRQLDFLTAPLDPKPEIPEEPEVPTEPEDEEQDFLFTLLDEPPDIHIDTVLDIDTGNAFISAGYISLPLAGSVATLAKVRFIDNIRYEEDKQRELELISDVYRGFGEYCMFTRESAGITYFFYGKKTDIEIVGYDYLLLVSDIPPLVAFTDSGFTNFALLDGLGVVVDMLHADSGVAGFNKLEYDGEYLDFGGKKYMVFSRNFESSFGEYSLAGLIARSTIMKHISSISARLYLFMMICSLVMCAFFVLFLLIIKIDKILLGTGEFRIDVDVSGNITKTDKNLDKKYKKMIGNIGKYLEHEFSKDCVIIKAENEAGERAYLNCRREVRNKSDYVFMASDVTDLYSDYMAFRKEHFTDDVTSMNNIQQLEKDFDTGFSERGKKTLVFIIYELGIEKYLAMYGIEFYKKLLKMLADRLSEIYVWQAKAYYLTGDRFIIMAEKDVQEVIAKIDSAIEFIVNPVRIDELIIRTTCNAGYVIYAANEEELSLSQIISRAELALSYAKSSNKKNYYGYVDSVMRSKQTLSNEDIRQIINEEELKICFQPQYSLSKKCIVGFEALTRLSGKYSYINPGVFIENVEQIGAMVMLGDYIIDKAMKFAATLPQKDIKISVNVSPVQLLGDKFVERFLLKMSEYKLEPSQIGIEITETYEMSSMAKAREKLRDIQKQGILVGIDDFGEKYSSLRYIKSLPIDFIKIDKGFTDDVETDKYSKAIIENIIALAKSLGLYTTVEGVETASQVKILEKLGADVIQGYVVSPAVDEEKAVEYIKSKKNLFN